MDAPKGIREEILEETKRRKKSYFRREIEEVQAILKTTDREELFPLLCTASLLLFAAGAAIAAMIGNVFLVPVLACGFLFLPFWYIRLTASHFKKDVSSELETALSIITTAYLRSEDILTSVEENLEYLNPPVKTVFADFVSRIRLIDPDLEAALEELKGKIENDVFMEWVDALKSCLYDRSLKTTLTPIVAKLSDMRIVNAELEYLVFEPRKEFITRGYYCHNKIENYNNMPSKWEKSGISYIETIMNPDALRNKLGTPDYAVVCKALKQKVEEIYGIIFQTVEKIKQDFQSNSSVDESIIQKWLSIQASWLLETEEIRQNCIRSWYSITYMSVFRKLNPPHNLINDFVKGCDEIIQKSNSSQEVITALRSGKVTILDVYQTLYDNHEKEIKG